MERRAAYWDKQAGRYDREMDRWERPITIRGDGGDEIEAYLARPMSQGPFGGVVVIHHMPGYDAPTKEIARRFAEHGYNALMPNLYHRDAPGASPDDAAATARAQGGVPDARLIGDVAGAAAHLRALTTSNGKVGVIGYCSGGRQSCPRRVQACPAKIRARSGLGSWYDATCGRRLRYGGRSVTWQTDEPGGFGACGVHRAPRRRACR